MWMGGRPEGSRRGFRAGDGFDPAVLDVYAIAWFEPGDGFGESVVSGAVPVLAQLLPDVADVAGFVVAVFVTVGVSVGEDDSGQVFGVHGFACVS